MLQGLRKGSKHPAAKILLVLVLIAFAGLGIGSFIPSLQMQNPSVCVSIQLPNYNPPIN